jgi:hypothetical protein
MPTTPAHPAALQKKRVQAFVKAVREALNLSSRAKLVDSDKGAILFYRLTFGGENNYVLISFDEKGRVYELSAPIGATAKLDELLRTPEKRFYYSDLHPLDAASVVEEDDRFQVGFYWNGATTDDLCVDLIVELVLTALPETTTGALMYCPARPPGKRQGYRTIKGFIYDRATQGYIEKVESGAAQAARSQAA